MEIIVLIKQVPKSKQAKLRLDYTIARETASNEMNPNDRHAIEEALRLKKTDDIVTVITMGQESAKEILKQALAMGVDDAVLITDKVFSGSDTFATAFIISSLIKKKPNCGMIVCGKQSTDSSTAQVPSSLAAMLGWEVATNVVSTELSGNQLICSIQYEDVLALQALYLPVVLSVNKRINVPRIASINGMLYSAKHHIAAISNSELLLEANNYGLEGSLTRVKTAYRTPIYGERKKVLLEKKLDNDFLRSLYSGFQEKQKYKPKQNVLHLDSDTQSSILVFCEVREGYICKESIEILHLAGELAKNTGARILAFMITQIIRLKHDMEWFSQRGVSELHILQYENQYCLSQKTISESIVRIIQKKSPEIILFAGTIMGRGVAPYIAARIRAGLTADCIELYVEEGKLIQVRPAFGGELNAVIETINSRYQMATVKPGVYTKQYYCTGVDTKCFIYEGDTFGERHKLKRLENNIPFDKDIVFGIGKGIGTKQNLEFLIGYCMMHDYGICATRGVVDLGILPYEYQVGLTGAVIEPKIYIAIGISGANEHMVGVRCSDLIIAVNSDTNAPIVSQSDYVYAYDIKEFISVLDGK